MGIFRVDRKGKDMLKGLFRKALPTPLAEGVHSPSPEEEILRILVQKYCLNQHICLKKLIYMMEREIIYLVLEEAHGNQRAAARILGVKPNTLHYKIHRMGLVPFHKYVMVEDLPNTDSPMDSPARTGFIPRPPRSAH